MFLYLTSEAQIPKIQLENLKGKSVLSTDLIKNNNKPVILSFWATWCKPCIKELNVYNENYIDWKDETGVKLIAISIDDTRSIARVAPFVNGRGWDFEVYLDKNSDFKRALNIINVPHTILLDGTGKIVWQHNSFAEGDEIELYELLIKLNNGETIDK